MTSSLSMTTCPMGVSTVPVRRREPRAETKSLSWGERFRILKEVAAVLLYLREEWDKVVVHQDIEASNVLLRL